MRKTIHEIKYRGLTPVLRLLSRCIKERYEAIPYIVSPALQYKECIDIILIPIPMHVREQRRRGFNQTSVLAQELAQRFCWKVASDLLYKRKSTISQTALTKEERRENITGVFKIKKPLKKQAVYVLVDDVITSGATIAEAASILRKAGARQVWALTIARG